MKRQIFSKENEINSKKISEHSPKTKHNFNYIDSANNNYKYRSNEKPRNRENEKNNKSNNKIKKGKMGEKEEKRKIMNMIII